MANGNGSGRVNVTWQGMAGLLWILTMSLIGLGYKAVERRFDIQEARLTALEQDWASLAMWRGEITMDVRRTRELMEREWGDSRRDRR